MDGGMVGWKDGEGERPEVQITAMGLSQLHNDTDIVGALNILNDQQRLVCMHSYYACTVYCVCIYDV